MRPVDWNILVLSFALLAAAKKCPPPRRDPHTRLIGKNASRQKFSVGEKVFYHCAEGLTPSSGSPTVQCQHNGTWTQLRLKCEKKLCGDAGDLRNGYFDYNGTSVGDKVFAKCNEGYILKGQNFLTCKKSGWAGEVPTCVEGEATCSPPVVANSVSSGGAVSAYRVGDSMTFICSQGFQLDGAQQITCGPGGQWQPQPPRCLPSPERAARLPEKATRLSDKPTGGCGVPKTTSTSNADLADKYITKSSFASGERVHYVCDVGYIQAGGSRYRTCKDGTWTPLHFRCERRSCGSAGEIANGQFEYTGVEFGDTAEAVCDEGHRVVGRATRTCMSEGWDGRVPTCEPVGCEVPPEVPNAEMTGHQEPPYTYRSAVVYQCRVGTLQGAREIWCTKDGTWSAPPPTCKEIMCPSPKVHGTYWAGAQRSLYQYRDTISIECYPGLERSGPRVITCDSDGKWSPGLPACRPVHPQGEATCSPPVVANSVSSGGAVSAYRVGDSMTFICSQGFQLDGAQQITCGPGGQWQPQPPRCLPSPERATLSPERATLSPKRAARLPDKPTGGCGVPKTTSTSNADLSDKYITKSSFASGERVHYVCDVGYIQAGGSRYRTCKDGTWTPLYFRCERRSCGSAGEIANGQFEYTGVEFGDTAEAVCDEGHRVVGRATRTCMSEGWDGRVPTCEPVGCEAPPEVPNAEMMGHQEPPYTYRSAVVYQCRVGTLQGAREIWCTKDGTWSAPPPTCKEIMCPPPKVYGTYWAGAQRRLYQYRDTISIECYPGLKRSGPRVVTCNSDGQWYPGLPTCRPVRPLHRSAHWGK